MTRHAFLSASSSHRWLKCPIAPTLESKIPQTTSSYALEGTFAHNLLAHCLEKGVDAETFANRKITFENDTRIVDAEMASSVQMACEYVRSFSGNLLSETEVPLEPFTTEKGATGTADIIIFNNKHWVIADFKYGAGVPVNPEHNPQLMLYALGALHQYGDIFGSPETVTLTIIQPRIRAGSPLQEWTISSEELREKAKEFQAKGKHALSLKGKRAIPQNVYGVDEDACRFCRAKTRCPALSRHVLLETIRDPKSGCEVDLSKAYSSLPLIEQYIKALKEEVFKRLSEGEEVKGYQLVEGRKGNRTFKDIEQATEYLTGVLGDKAFKKILLSPKEVEQFRKDQTLSSDVWEELQELITRGDGKPVIAPRDIPPVPRIQKAEISDFASLD
ncbi:hypothetical protein CKC_01065 [Candidatus Liberibacter solanacearum CLso-ZC1]|uniref:DUF2800 domain-containing protein n=1 Tax=Liberibacter solanacearum (strain CLso-ZC1) TaxID=658172 RepID=E4UC74_LIBSC|nr:DUF2800 domain-containing protein [Candidatus Liberibacter solanacearum]ADR51964.1 hypothetical protein CKC_01065 [Candidatus Liberibacter solanacearum CLso-ZC1]